MDAKTSKTGTNKETELISVIVPVYKVEKYLDACVRSIVGQSYDNLEILLIDDGSPDNCPAMCDEWAKRDERIKVFHKPNSGLAGVRNFGLKHMTGKYLTWVDSDDTIHPDSIKILYENLKNHNADISMGSWQKIYDIENYEDAVLNHDPTNVVVYEGDHVFGLLFEHTLPLIMASWSKLYSRDVYEGVVYPEGRVHEDEWAHHIFANAGKLVFEDVAIYNNLQRDGSITGKKFNVARLGAIENLYDRVKFCETQKPEFYQPALNQYLRIVAYYYALAKRSGLDKEVLDKLILRFDEGYALLDKKSLALRVFKHNKPLFCFLSRFKRG